MEIKNRPLSEILPYGKNAKKHPDKQVLAVANSITEFGFNQPIVVDKDSVIIVGHGRFLAATFLGLTEVPVLELDLPEEKAKAYRLAEQSGKTTIWTMKREPTKDYVHPTQKPVELIMYALANSSKVDDNILDPFLGSGATLIACQKTNRTCWGMELDPRFCDVIVQRWCDYTENKSIKLNGESVLW